MNTKAYKLYLRNGLIINVNMIEEVAFELGKRIVQTGAAMFGTIPEAAMPYFAFAEIIGIQEVLADA